MKAEIIKKSFRNHQCQRLLPYLVAALLLFTAPLFLSGFRLNLLGRFVAFAILAVGLDLIWGYGGMLSLGHGVFFGLGAYCMAMYMKLEAVDGGLPDFMAWSGLRELPWFWLPFQSPTTAIFAALILPALAAAVLGYFTFRSRIHGVYFSILTQALVFAVTIVLIAQQPYTGGTNGITDFSTLFGHRLSDPGVQRVIYFITAATLVSVLTFCRWLTASPFGRLLIAIRDEEERVRFSGYNPVVFKTVAFALSGAIAGIAGALFVPQVGIIAPGMIGVVPSIFMVVWVAVGGRETLFGAVIGALLVNQAQIYMSELYPAFWSYFLGGLFIVSVLYLPGGIIGLWRKYRAKRLGAPQSTVKAEPW